MRSFYNCKRLFYVCTCRVYAITSSDEDENAFFPSGLRFHESSRFKFSINTHRFLVPTIIWADKFRDIYSGVRDTYTENAV